MNTEFEYYGKTVILLNKWFIDCCGVLHVAVREKHFPWFKMFCDEYDLNEINICG